MLKSLIKIRFQGIFMRSMKGSKNKNAGIGKLALMVLVFAYIAIVFGSMFGYMFNMVLEPFTAIGYEWLYFGIMADIIFEIPVEGDATRFMALYGDYTAVPKICAIRSCRAYFPALSEGFDAFYVNWGSDDTIGEYIASLNLDQIDGISDGSGLFGRDQARLSAGYDLEHTGYFDGTQFASVVQSRGLRTDIEEDKKDAAFSFYGLNEQVKPDGEDCQKVDINFGAARATLTYDEAKKVYVKDLNGKPQIDGNTGEQLAFTNVFVLETSITVRDEIGHKEVDWDGASDSVGYYISNGGVQKIHWSKEEKNEQSRLKFYDQNGKEIKINRGKSYIAVNYADQATFQ